MLLTISKESVGAVSILSEKSEFTEEARVLWGFPELQKWKMEGPMRSVSSFPSECRMAPYRACTRAALGRKHQNPGAIETVSLQFMHNKGLSPQILIHCPPENLAKALIKQKSRRPFVSVPPDERKCSRAIRVEGNENEPPIPPPWATLWGVPSLSPQSTTSMSRNGGGDGSRVRNIRGRNYLINFIGSSMESMQAF